MATSRARARRGAVRSARASARPGLEALEGRQLLATFPVTTTADSGPGSFRQAILNADAAPGPTDIITFSIGSGTGVRTISPTTPLPAITTAITIDATTEPGYLGNPLIVLDGSKAGAGADGLTISGGGTTVRGLVVDNFNGSGIVLLTGGNNTLIEDFVGVNAVGLLPSGNQGGGIVVNNSAGNIIGGTTRATEVIVSGNAGPGIEIVGSASTGNAILGGYIGIDATGTVAIGNSGPGIEILQAGSTTIGSSTSGGQNVISGNGQTGISILGGATGTQVLGNFIGSNISGTGALPNNLAGIEINGSTSNTIGGTTSGDQNVISGNSGPGVSIDGATATGNLLAGNLIGVTTAGTAALANQSDGVRITGGSTETVGGVGSGDGNVISGNLGNGVSLLGGTTGAVIQGNEIGTDSTGNLKLGNALEGVFVQGSSTNTIGAPSSASGSVSGSTNQILNNGMDGVFVASGVADTIRQNATTGNGQLAIGLGTGANNNLVAPSLSAAYTSAGSTTITGTYSGTSGTTYILDFYSNPVYYSGLGQGKVYVGSTTVTPGSTGSATFTFSPANPVVLASVVSATATDVAGDTSEFSNQALVSPPTVNLGISGSGSVNPVGIGQTLVDTFVVTNFGPSSATDVTVNDTLPSGVNVLGTSATAGVITLSGSSFSVNLGSLAVGGTATVMLRYQPLVAGTINDVATVTTADQTVSPGSGTTSTVSTVVQPSAYLLLSDSASPASVGLGGLVAFNLTVQNKGPSPATGVTVSDVLPTGATLISATSSQGSTPTSGGTVTASLGTIAAGGSATATIVVQPTSAGTVTDAASLSSTSVNPYPTNVTASGSATVTSSSNPSNPTGADGPKVVGVARSGVGNMPTKYAIGFDSPLFVATAQDLSNYSLVDLGTNGKGSKTVPLVSAIFDPSNNSVTLSPSKKINIHDRVRLTVNGLPPNGLTGADGLYIDGSGSGTPGSNFSATFSGFGPPAGSLSTASVHPAGPKSTRRR